MEAALIHLVPGFRAPPFGAEAHENELVPIDPVSLILPCSFPRPRQVDLK